MMRQVEVLAPAGSMESLKAAFLNGADAVYLGGELFGARAYASNFLKEELLEAIDYAHKFHKKVYLTVNTLVKEEELEGLVSYILPYYERGLDAVLVQDFGVLEVLKEHFPDLELHASTQMTVTSVESACMLKELGVKRVVPARELSLEEIHNIKSQTGLDVECFVHGALCYCYSGQCFMSSMIGGRSGNRGRCAGTCRLPFDMFQENQKINEKNHRYLLSPKDLCAIDILPQIIEVGVDSLKIEGRMKNPEYVGAVSRIYRKYVDLYFSGKPYKVTREDRQMLLELFNRGGFTDGYYKKHNGKDMMSMERPNHQGILIGKIKQIKGGTLTILLQHDLNKGDILEIPLGDMDEVELTSPIDAKQGDVVTLNGQKMRRLRVNMSVYRTKNHKLRLQLQEDLKEKNKEILKGKVKFIVGKPVTLEIENQDFNVQVSGDVVQVAQNRPMDEEQIKKQLRKTGETDYTFSTLDVETKGDGFLPVKALKNLRRDAFEQLEQEVLARYKRNYQQPMPGKLEIKKKQPLSPKVSVVLDDIKLLPAIGQEVEVARIYLPFLEVVKDKKAFDLAKKLQKEIYLVMPQVTRKDTLRLFEQNLSLLQDDGMDGFLVQSMDQIHWMKAHNITKHKMLNYNVYNYNHRSVSFYQELLGEDVGFTYPIECNQEEMKNLGIFNGEIYFYGHLPLMISAQCQKKNTLGCDKKSCILTLKDRKNQDFYVKNHCDLCYNEILNGVPIWLGTELEQVLELEPEYIRLHFTIETEDEAKHVIKEASSLLHGINSHSYVTEYTKGHFKRGIL